MHHGINPHVLRDYILTLVPSAIILVMFVIAAVNWIHRRRQGSK